MTDDPDLAFPAQVVVTPAILGEALASITKQTNEDADRVNQLGMGLLMFVEILRLEARDRKGES
jgi:hypothetical protein